MTDQDDDALTRVAALVAAAENAIQVLDIDPADGWGMLAAERLDVIQMVERITRQPLSLLHDLAVQGLDAGDPAALYEAAAAVAREVDSGKAPAELLAELAQALTNAATTARMVRRGPSSI